MQHSTERQALDAVIDRAGNLSRPFNFFGTSRVTAREYALICATQAIVLELAAESAVPPISMDSQLPARLLQNARQALAAYGWQPGAAS